MSGHTPGPWATGKGYGLHGVEIVGDEGRRAVCGVIGVDRDLYDKAGRKIASEPTPDGWANARLIAAAPDLLEELRETHAALCFTPDYIGTLRYERNKAAIARATGAAP